MAKEKGRAISLVNLMMLSLILSDLDEGTVAVEENKTVCLCNEDPERTLICVNPWYSGDPPGLLFVCIAFISGMLSLFLVMHYGLRKLITHMNQYGQYLHNQRRAEVNSSHV